MKFITEPILQALLYLQQNVFQHDAGSFGWAIIALTIVIRVVLVPFTLPALKSQKAMRSLQPKLKELKTKYGSDKAKFAEAQMELYKEYKINPFAGCLPYLLQFVIVIALYRVIQQFLTSDSAQNLEAVMFFGFNLTQKDGTYILPVLAGFTQFVLALLLAPGANRLDVVPEKSASKVVKELNKEETSQEDMASMMQKQMMFVMPVMTGVFAATFPSGIAVYWIVANIVSIVQQIFVTGWGGLEPYLPQNFIKKFSREPQIGVTRVIEAQVVEKTPLTSKKKTRRPRRK